MQVLSTFISVGVEFHSLNEDQLAEWQAAGGYQNADWDEFKVDLAGSMDTFAKLEEAAATLGASRARVFSTVTLPLILPGVIAGSVLAFAKAMGEFGATITFVSNIPGETRTVPSAIYAFLQVPGGEDAAMRLVLVAIFIAIGALILSEWLSRRVARRIAGK